MLKLTKEEIDMVLAHRESQKPVKSGILKADLYSIDLNDVDDIITSTSHPNVSCDLVFFEKDIEMILKKIKKSFIKIASAGTEFQGTMYDGREVWTAPDGNTDFAVEGDAKWAKQNLKNIKKL